MIIRVGALKQLQKIEALPGRQSRIYDGNVGLCELQKVMEATDGGVVHAKRRKVTQRALGTTEPQKSRWEKGSMRQSISFSRAETPGLESQCVNRAEAARHSLNVIPPC